MLVALSHIVSTSRTMNVKVCGTCCLVCDVCSHIYNVALTSNRLLAHFPTTAHARPLVLKRTARHAHV